MNPIPPDAVVLDRIVDGQRAVLLVGPDEVELVIDLASLPEGAAEGDWFRLTLSADVELTSARRSDAEDRLARIRMERSAGRFSSEQ